MWITAADPRGPTDDFWYMPTGSPTAAGVMVSPEHALRLTIVYACVKVLAETVAQLPLILYRRLDRGKERATDHPLYWLIGRRPNVMQTSFEWREMMQGHLGLRGNGFSEILYSGNRVIGLKPYHPDMVRVEDLHNGSWRYLVRDKQSDPERPLVRSEMLHLRGLSTNGIMGLNPIETEREAIGFALAAQEHGARFYKNGAVFPGWIEHPAYFKNPEDRNRFREKWQESQTGGNRFKTPILEYGMKYHEVPIKHTDAQYIETLKRKDEDIARIFRMPPHKVGILDKATFSNIEQQGIEFVTDTMMPWLVRWEQRLSESLLTQDEQEEYFFEFLIDGLLRGDSVARSGYYNKGILDGWLTRNEVRELENRNPLSGLDEPLEPLNMARANEPRQNDRERALTVAAAERVLHKEATVLRKLIEKPDADIEVAKFYEEHVVYVSETMLIRKTEAAEWCSEQRKVFAAIDPNDRPIHLSAWESRAQFLAELVSKESEQ